jgi:hypothetical protein
MPIQNTWLSNNNFSLWYWSVFSAIDFQSINILQNLVILLFQILCKMF